VAKEDAAEGGFMAHVQSVQRAGLIWDLDIGPGSITALKRAPLDLGRFEDLLV
jgi:hypothetical protein